MELRRSMTTLQMSALLAVAAAAGCGGESPGGAALGTGGGHATVHRLDDSSDGHTVHVRVGDTVAVALRSTYWQLPVPTGGELVATASPAASPGGNGCPTIPGTGCGTASARYRVATTGRTTLIATRQSCGEAMRCTGSQGRWSVTVIASS